LVPVGPRHCAMPRLRKWPAWWACAMRPSLDSRGATPWSLSRSAPSAPRCAGLTCLLLRGERQLVRRLVWQWRVQHHEGPVLRFNRCTHLPLVRAPRGTAVPAVILAEAACRRGCGHLGRLRGRYRLCGAAAGHAASHRAAGVIQVSLAGRPHHACVLHRLSLKERSLVCGVPPG